MKSIELIADYAKRYPADPDLFQLWELLGADDFIALHKKAAGRRISYKVEYRNFDLAVLASCEIVTKKSVPA